MNKAYFRSILPKTLLAPLESLLLIQNFQTPTLLAGVLHSDAFSKDQYAVIQYSSTTPDFSTLYRTNGQNLLGSVEENLARVRPVNINMATCTSSTLRIQNMSLDHSPLNVYQWCMTFGAKRIHRRPFQQLRILSSMRRVADCAALSFQRRMLKLIRPCQFLMALQTTLRLNSRPRQTVLRAFRINRSMQIMTITALKLDAACRCAFILTHIVVEGLSKFRLDLTVALVTERWLRYLQHLTLTPRLHTCLMNRVALYTTQLSLTMRRVLITLELLPVAG